MAEPSPTLVTDAGETLVYRPISGLAVTSFALGALYVTLLVLYALIALGKGEPFFMPGFLVALPAAAVVLAVLAQRQIRNSEDTRAGEQLARWGLWLGILSGLGYLTYSFFTGLAIKEQANRFLMEKGPEAGFFPLVLSGQTHDLHAAFLLTQTVTERKGFKPTDTAKLEDRFDHPLGPQSARGRLTNFLDSPLVRLLQQDRKATVEPIGVKSWDYEGRGYKVERNYRITTQEGVFDFLLTAVSADVEDGRKWTLSMRPDMLVAMKFTPEGKRMQDMRRLAANFAGQWLVHLARGAHFDAYLATRPPSERPQLKEWNALAKKHHATITASLAWSHGAHVASLPAIGLVPLAAVPHGFPRHADEAASLFLPQFPAFARGSSYLRVDQLRSLDTKMQEVARQLVPRLFEDTSRTLPRIDLRSEPTSFSLWKEARPGEVEIYLDFDMALPLVQQGTPSPGSQVLGKLVVAAPANLDPARADALEQFRVLELRCERVLALPAGGPGG